MTTTEYTTVVFIDTDLAVPTLTSKINSVVRVVPITLIEPTNAAHQIISYVHFSPDWRRIFRPLI